MDNAKHQKFLQPALLLAGFLGLSILGYTQLKWGSGLATIVWILAFLGLTCGFRTKRGLLLSAFVFCLGYEIRFLFVADQLWMLPLFLVMGLITYGIFLLYAQILNKWDHVVTTLLFPVIWTAVYALATLVRFPSLIRVDVLFMDMQVLIQSERLIGSTGLGFLILWALALLHYAARRRNIIPAAVGIVLFLIPVLIGLVRLYPNTAYTDSVRVAYTTGPYIGDYLTYTTLPAETYLENVERSAEEAADGGASVLMFSEEAFEIGADEVDPFLERCRTTARENSLHILVCLDIDRSSVDEGAKSLNRIYWIDSGGEILGSYQKAKLIPVIESDYEQGDGTIPSHTITVDGRELTVSYLICYDSNFPHYVRTIDDDTDILFLPSWDWRAVTELHSRICYQLAVENRVSILKCTYDGISIAVDPDGTIIHSTDTNDIGFGQLQLVDIPVKGGQQMMASHDLPGYVYSIFAVEIMSILVCLILLIANIFENREKTTRNRTYTIIVITCIVALAADAASWILDGSVRLTTFLFICSAISMALTFVLTGEFIVYLTAYIREREPIAGILQHIYFVFGAIAVVFVIIGSLNGKLFFFENGTYSDGPWYELYVIVNILTVVLSLIILVFYAKSLTLHDIIATSAYITIPSLSAIINIFIPEFSFAYPAITLSLVVFYVMLQSERVQRLKDDEQASSHMASHDEMTGLLNRRAYVECTQALAESEDPTGVIFSDMNGLKYANDNFGHEAGDRLLRKYSELLSVFFRKEEIYRISGDEFVVIMPNVTKECFDQRIEKLEQNLEQNGTRIACIGTAFGRGREVDELLKTAESLMYVQKDAFHELHPEMKRG